jgi:hypothetical protein
MRPYRERDGPRDGHPAFNIRHVYQVACRDHRVRLSYRPPAWSASSARAGGIAAAASRRPCYGELLHLDGRRHP